MAFTQISTDGIKNGTITGSDLATNIDLVDNQKLRVGTGNDLQLYHDGSHSYIDNVVTGDLKIRSTQANGDVNIVCSDSNGGFNVQSTTGETLISSVANGAVSLYYANAKKLETIAGGVSITGELNVTTKVAYPDNGKAIFGTGDDLQIYHDGTNNIINTTSGSLLHQYNGTTVALQTDTRLGFQDNKKASFGTGNDLEIYHDGSNSFIFNDTGQLQIQTDFFGLTPDDASEYMIFANKDGPVNLYYNGSKKFETKSGGAKVSGQLQATGGFLTVDAASYKISNSSVGSSSTTYYIGNQAIQTSSDRRIKENIVNTEVDALSELKKVRVVDFNWNDPSDTAVTNRNSRGKWTGCIAQEIVDVFPFAVNAPRTEDNKIDNDSEALWGMEYGQLVPVLIKAIQELEAEVAALKAA